MKKYILHSISGDVREYPSKDTLKVAVENICWGAGLKSSIIKDLDLNYHCFLYDEVGRYIIINGGEICVPRTSNPYREAVGYILNNLPNLSIGK